MESNLYDQNNLFNTYSLDQSLADTSYTSGSNTSNNNSVDEIIRMNPVAFPNGSGSTPQTPMINKGNNVNTTDHNRMTNMNNINNISPYFPSSANLVFSLNDTSNTPLSSSLHYTVNDSNLNTPFTSMSPYKPSSASSLNVLENDLVILNNTNNANNYCNANCSIQHNRTNSLPTSFKLLNSNQHLPYIPNSNSSLRSTPMNNNLNTNFTHNDHYSFNINRFSLPSIIDDDLSSATPTSTSALERQLNNLSFELSPSSITPTRRNTMFSNASISSTATSASVISSSSNSNPNSASNRTCNVAIPSITPIVSNQVSTTPLNANNVNANFHSNSNSNSNSSSNSSTSSGTNANHTSASTNPAEIRDFSPKTMASSHLPQSSPYSASSAVDLSSLSPNDIIILSKDQHGCRMLQKKIDDDCATNLPIIFNATYKHSSALMLDPFGNYLIQKLMVAATPSQLSLIIIEITPNIGKIATNLHGTRALQKLIGCLSTPNHHDLIALAISPQIVNLVHDLNGNHVIQKLISHFFGDDLDFLVDLIIIHLIQIASHKHGCCVLQKLLNKCSPYQIQKISNEILRNSVHLMKDQFGNYVIQYLISLDINGINLQLLQLVANELVPLSCGKFSSNVVEKCLKLNPHGCTVNDSIHPLLAAMINIQTLMTLIKDQYGNYVVQTALEVADWPIKCVMAEMVRPMLPNIRYTNYGKRIHIKVVSILAELDNNNSNNNNNNHKAAGSNSSSFGSQANTKMKANETSNNTNINSGNNLLPGINFSAHA